MNERTDGFIFQSIKSSVSNLIDYMYIVPVCTVHKYMYDED
jgi:hypothetical protein